MKKLIAALACTAMFAGVLAGCGSSSTTQDVKETVVQEDATKEVVSTNGKVWKIATDTTFKPFEYTNESGEFVGIDVDILAAIAADQGFEYELQILGWDGALAAVQVGQADGLIAGASIKQERIDSGWIFSEGYYTATQTFFVGEDSDISSFEDLAGANVAVKNGTAGAEWANSLKEQYGFEVTVYEDSPTMYLAVINGNSVAGVEDTPIMASSIKEGELKLKIPEGMEGEPAPYGFAIMNEENAELLEMFNAGLANIIENGTYQEILDKYL